MLLVPIHPPLETITHNGQVQAIAGYSDSSYPTYVATYSRLKSRVCAAVQSINPKLAEVIVRLRRNLGYFQGLADLESVPGMTADVMTRLQSMMEEARQFSGYLRE